ncbi:MAG: 2-C-methyl-D-erythritol 2,4-cyclodiphosphate synthase, partial [Clostridia bacterium]
LAPHILSIRTSLASALSIPLDRVNLSATTSEHLGSLGAGDGIACECITLLQDASDNYLM